MEAGDNKDIVVVDGAPIGAADDEENQVKLKRLATEINTIKEQTIAAVQNATLEIGKRLLEAKGAVGHGNWGQWLADNVDYKERTAQNIIAIYERFGTGQLKLFGKCADPEQVRKLNRSQMLALMSIKDEDECFEFMEQHKDDLQDMSKRELESAIKKLETVEAERDAALRIINEKQRDLETTVGAIEKQKQLYETEIKELEERLSQASNKKINDLKVLEELRDNYDSMEKELEGLRQERDELLNAPIETTVVEKVPEETVKELETMRARINELEQTKPEKSKAERMFIHHFENIRTELQSALDSMGQIETDRVGKYRGVLNGLLKETASYLESQE